MASNVERIREAEHRVADLQAKLELLQGGLGRIETAARAAEEAREPARRLGLVLAVALTVGLAALIVTRRRRRRAEPTTGPDPATTAAP